MIVTASPGMTTHPIWKGGSGVDGHAKLIISALKSAQDSCKVYIKKHLPSLGSNHELTNEMETTSYEFHLTLYAHIREEIDTLLEYGIEEDQALILVSEEIGDLFLFSTNSLSVERTSWIERWTLVKQSMLIGSFELRWNAISRLKSFSKMV